MTELKKESYRKGFIVSSSITLLLKIVSFFSSILFAYYFGTNPECDLYIYCISGITLFAAFLTVLDASILIPEGMRIQEEKGNEASQQFYNSFLILLAMVCIAGVAIVFVLGPEKSVLFFSKFKKELIYANSSLILLCLPIFFIVTINMFLVDIVFSYKYFSVGACSSFLLVSAQIICILLFQKAMHIKSAAIGNLIGNTAQSLFLIIFLKRQCKWKFFSYSNIFKKKIISDGVYSIAGNTFSYLASFVSILCLSGLPEGLVASANYAQKVIDIINVLIINQFALIFGIKINELFAKKKPELISDSFYSLGSNILFLIIPSCFIFSVFSTEIMTLFFKRGAFTSTSVKTASFFLSYLILILPCLAINTMISRLFNAAQKLKYSIGYQSIMSIFQIVLLLIGVKIFKVNGYIGAIIIFNVLNVFLEYFLMKPNFPEIQYVKLVKHFGFLLLVNLIPLFVLYIYKRTLYQIPIAFYLITGVSLYCGILIFLTYKFKINTEVANVLRKSLKKLTGFLPQ